MNKAKYNSECYADPTAYAGMKDVVKEENKIDKRAYDLIKVLKFIIKACGFELVERIKIKDVESGKEYR